MSECLSPHLSVYSSSLVIYSSPLVIYSCRLRDAFIKCLFKCFIHMTDFFLFLFKHLVTKTLQQLSVLFPNMFFPTIFSCKWLITCYTLSFIFSWWFSLHYLFFLHNNNLFIVFFNLTFWGAITRVRFTCFIYAIVYFLSIAEHLSQKFHQSSVFSSSISFYTHFSMLMIGYMSHTKAYFFIKVLNHLCLI